MSAASRQEWTLSSPGFSSLGVWSRALPVSFLGGGAYQEPQALGRAGIQPLTAGEIPGESKPCGCPTMQRGFQEGQPRPSYPYVWALSEVQLSLAVKAEANLNFGADFSFCVRLNGG